MINRFVLGDQVLWLDRRWSIELFRSGGYFGSEDILFKDNLLDELFQVFSEGLIIDGLLSLAVMVGTIFFYFRK